MDQLLSSQPLEELSSEQAPGRSRRGARTGASRPPAPLPTGEPLDDNLVIRAPLGRYVRPSIAATATGLTVKAIERKIEDGKWIEGREYRRAPDGRIYIDMRGFEKWVETAAA
jgi:hypothetical protein